ncbi:MAG TPA: alanine--glyoxylate aminotransferase family protein [Bryobacteraceae bacterium]|nr:alanine--glyoxylate aminotransferase family protein [Bryobacteraceae bacterium]
MKAEATVSPTEAKLRPPQRLLFGPGPTMVEPSVYEAMEKPVVGPLDPYFFDVADHVREMLRAVFGTRNEVTVVVPGTGSSGMETAVANFVEPGSKCAIFANGYFADRLSEMARRQEATVVRLEKPWGQVFSYQDAAEFVYREKPAVVAFVHAETSTGALQDPKLITKAAREVDALAIADTVTSLGALPVGVDEAGIDVAYSCTQKGLSCPPGLSPLTASARAMEWLKGRKTPVRQWYLDLKLLVEYFDGHKYHHTVSTPLFYALHEGLRLIAAEGLENRWERHRSNHLSLVAGLERMGLEMHVAAGHRIPNVNTPRVPRGVDDVKVRKYLLDKYRIDIAGGFGELYGKIFRIGLMGPLANQESVTMLLDAMQDALAAVTEPRP